MQQIQASCNAELFEGATDGKIKKVRPHTRVADFAGDAMIRDNKAGLFVPSSGAFNPYGPTPLDEQHYAPRRPA